MKKCVGSLQKQNRRSFQYTKFSVIDFVLIDRRNLLGTQPKSACSKSSSTRFSFSAARNAITKTTKYVTFGFYVRILVFSPLERTLSVSYSGHNPRKFRQTTLDWEWWGFAVHSSPWPSGTKGEWRVSTWLAISNTSVKISNFFTCVFTAFLTAGNPCITP